MPKTYRVCDHCGKKGVYVVNGWPYWGDGTECCRYCHRYYHVTKESQDSSHSDLRVGD